MRRNRTTKILIELTALVAGTATVYAFATRFDWIEGLTRWVLAHGVRQLEMVLASVFFGTGLIVFALSRWRETELELVSRQHAEVAGKLLHEELDLRVKQRTVELSSANQALQAEVAERRKSAEALIQANERTESVLAGMADLYFVIDHQWRYLYANEAAVNAVSQATDAPRDRILGRSLWDLFPNIAGTELERQFRRAMVDRVAVNVEFFHVPLDVWWHYRIYPAAGGVAVFANDITASKLSVESLRESEERFSSAFEHAPGGVALVSLDGRWLKVNLALCDLVGYSEAELLVRTFQDITHREDLAADLENVRRLIAGEIRSYRMEKRYVHARGHLIPVLLNVSLVRDGQGLPRHLIAHIQDITELKQGVEALRESEVRFRELAENIEEVFWISEPQKTQKNYLSPAFEKIWGRTCQSAYESPQAWLEAIRPEDRERVRQAAQDKQLRGTYDEEYCIVRPDGTERWIRDRAFPVRDADGAIKRWVGVAADITEYRLMEDQFRQSQKMEAIGTLAGGIAHDFNNILAAINGYTELSLMTLEENPRVREHLGAVLKASGRATDLVRQILTFSRQQPLARRAIQLGPVVMETFALLRATLPSTIEINLSLAADAPTVLADATQIHQILMNLGTNAWHAMKEQPGRLQVKLERCAFEGGAGTNLPWGRPGLFARVSISDTGCGMDAATRRRIFEPFFTTKPIGEGTGLGLAVVHGIMDSHDGTVRVQSEPGKGTTFQLYFPAHAGEVIGAALNEAPVPHGHGERVLVVDDEELLARLGQEALTALGYEVEFTTQPAAALAMVEADPQRFALVITDQTMPNMTGVVLASQLRRIQPRLPIILMTGYSTLLTPERLEAAGIRQFLLKPTTLHSLGAAVHAVLSVQPPH